MAKRDMGSANVTTKVGDHAPEKNTEYVFEPLNVPAGTPLAEVSATFGLTVNLGSYESARVDVGIRMPCLPENVSATYAKAQGWVENIVRAQVRQIRGGS